MRMALQTQRNGKVKISKANDLHGDRNTIRHAYITTLKKLGFEQEKGQLREGMTVASDTATKPTWRTNDVESRLGLPTGSFTNNHILLSSQARSLYERQNNDDSAV
jgi:hypothetical protein